MQVPRLPTSTEPERPSNHLPVGKKCEEAFLFSLCLLRLPFSSGSRANKTLLPGKRLKSSVDTVRGASPARVSMLMHRAAGVPARFPMANAANAA